MLEGERHLPETDVATRGAPDFATIGVLYEDADVLAVDKPAGLVVHPAYKHPDGTLSDAIFARQASRGAPRPWLLHRLDRETSGVVLFAKTEVARRGLVRQFERHTLRKLYLALTLGAPVPARGILEAPLYRDPADRRRTIVASEAGSGKAAITRYAVVTSAAGAALVLAEPLTGRTHQIRAHLAHSGTPLLGDTRYAPVAAPATPGMLRDMAARVMLHAWQVGIVHPTSGALLWIVAPLPVDMCALLARLGIGDQLGDAATLRGFDTTCVSGEFNATDIA